MPALHADNLAAIRRLSDGERMYLCWDLTDNPQLVTYIAVYPSVDSLPTQEALVRNARSVIEAYPMLKARVIDARTTKPKWGVLSESAVDAGLKTLVREVQMDTTDADKEESQTSRRLEQIFNKEIRDKQSLRARHNGLMWRVCRYYWKASPISAATTSPAFIVLTTNHVISDGTSGQALLGGLLSDTKPDLRDQGPEHALRPPAQFPPALDATVNCRPSLRYVLDMVWHELIVPALPRPIGAMFKMKPCWPASPPHLLEHSQQDDMQTFDHVQLTAEQVQRLKDNGKKHGVATLHPTLQIAAAVALWIVVEGVPLPGHDTGEHSKTLEIVHSAPISFRQTSLGHPPIGGNYVSPLFETRMSCARNGKTLFWQEAQEYARWIHSSAGRKRALHILGSLRFLPDGRNRDADEDSAAPTVWETFFLERSQREPSDSYGVSNLGYAKRPPGTIGMAWSQSATRFLSPAYFNIVGHEGGLDITVSWLKGAWANENGDDVRAHLAYTYKRVLGLLTGKAEDAVNGDGAGGVTFNTIRTLAQAG